MTLRELASEIIAADAAVSEFVSPPRADGTRLTRSGEVLTQNQYFSLLNLVQRRTSDSWGAAARDRAHRAVARQND